MHWSRGFVLVAIAVSFLACATTSSLKPGQQRPVFYPHGQTLKTVWRVPLMERDLMDFEPVDDGGVGVDAGEAILFAGGRSKILRKIDYRTGKVLRSRHFEEELFSKPVVYEHLLLLGTSSGELYAMRKHTFEDVWVYRSKSEFVVPPVVAGGIVYAITQNDVLTALDVQTGKFLWEAKEMYTGTMAIRRHAQPVIVGEKLFQGYMNGMLVAYNRFSGEELWRSHLGKGSRFDDVNATPVYKDGVLFVSSFDNGLYAINADNGRVVWFTAMKSVSGGLVWQDELLVTSSEGGFYALNQRSGVIDWYFDLHTLYRKQKEGAFSRPQFYLDRYVVFTTSESGLYVLDPLNRELVTRLAPGLGVSAEPTVSGPYIFLTTNGSSVLSITLTQKGAPETSLNE